MKTVHSLLRTRRLLAGLTQAQAGQIVGLTGAMISLCELGLRRMRPALEKRLFEICQIREVQND